MHRWPAIPAPTADCCLLVMAKNGGPSSQLWTRLMARGVWQDRAEVICGNADALGRR